MKKGDWFIDSIGNIGKIIRDVDPEGYTTALMGDDAKKGKGLGHLINVKFLKPYKAHKVKESKAGHLLGIINESKKWDFHHEYTLDKKAGGYPVGDLAFNYDYLDKSRNIGFIELELPLKDIDKDSLHGVMVRIAFHVDSMSIYNDDGLHVDPSVKMTGLPDGYLSVSTSTDHETKFNSDGDKQQVHKYITDNKSKMETTIEDFISDEMIAKMEKERDAF